MFQAIFDDGGIATGATLRYGWTALTRENGTMRVLIHVDMEIPDPAIDRFAGLTYFGGEHALAAQKGDFSFVRRFSPTLAQREHAAIVLPDPVNHTVPMVEFFGPLRMERNITATVFSANQTVHWDGDSRSGTWAFWVDPDTIPFEGARAGSLVRLWPTGAVEGNLRAITSRENEAFTRNVHAVAPGVDSWVGWTTAWFGLPSSALGTLRSYDAILENIYDPVSGVFVGTAAGMFADDTLIAQAGLILLTGSINDTMIVGSTTIDGVRAVGTEQKGLRSADGPPIVLLLAALTIAGISTRRARSK